MNLKYYLILFVVFSFWGCNQKDIIPAYIFIDSYQLTTTAQEGSNDHAITEIYLHVDGEFIGGFSLPAIIPVLKYGEQKILIDAVVHENGISNTPVIYPFYESVEMVVDLQPTEIDSLLPSTKYMDNVIFEIVDQFEGSSVLNLDLDLDDDTVLNFDKNGAFEGFSGKIELTGEHDTLAISTSLGMTSIPNSLFDDYFIELNYKSESIIRLGFRGVDIENEKVTFFTNAINPSDSWKKIYFNVTKPIYDSKLKYFQVFIETTLPDDKNKVVIWLDNFKFLHFKN